MSYEACLGQGFTALSEGGAEAAVVDASAAV